MTVQCWLFAFIVTIIQLVTFFIINKPVHFLLILILILKICKLNSVRNKRNLNHFTANAQINRKCN